jgi:hypothetical protein
VNINYQFLADAAKFYGPFYPEIQVPWFISDKALEATMPPQARRSFTTFAGNLVASGEQSYVQMMMDGTMPAGNWSCVTPCFRDEEYNKYHQIAFMKMELISFPARYKDWDDGTHHKVCEMEMRKMMVKALDFFSQYLPAEIIKTDIGYDIQAGSIELGSYGIRQSMGFRWVYGTGCAEPRLSQVLKRFEHQLLP